MLPFSDAAFGYRVDEVNNRGYAVAAAPLAYHAPAPLAYHAPTVVKTIAAPLVHAPTVHVAKTLAYGAPVVNAAHYAPLAYNYAPRAYDFGYAYGAASPALAYAGRHW